MQGMLATKGLGKATDNEALTNTQSISTGIGRKSMLEPYHCAPSAITIIRTLQRDCLPRAEETKTMRNQAKHGSMEARGVVHAFGGGETKQDLNNIEDEIEA
ncbi:hypothetical protein Tco_1102961 [Tanacetum coccineum]